MFQNIRLRLFPYPFHTLSFWPKVYARKFKRLALNKSKWHNVGFVLPVAVPGSQIPIQ